jgi:hypothetical protein
MKMDSVETAQKMIAGPVELHPKNQASDEKPAPLSASPNPFSINDESIGQGPAFPILPLPTLNNAVGESKGGQEDASHQSPVVVDHADGDGSKTGDKPEASKPHPPEIEMPDPPGHFKFMDDFPDGMFKSPARIALLLTTSLQESGGLVHKVVLRSPMTLGLMDTLLP